MSVFCIPKNWSKDWLRATQNLIKLETGSQNPAIYFILELSGYA